MSIRHVGTYLYNKEVWKWSSTVYLITRSKPKNVILRHPLWEKSMVWLRVAFFFIVVNLDELTIIKSIAQKLLNRSL